MKDNISPANRPFYDDIHFKGGIARSGHFTISEARDLVEYGVRFKQLAENAIEPATEDEQLFIDIISGKAPVTQYSARLWLKYTDAIDETKHRVSAFGKNFAREYPMPVQDLDYDLSISA